MASEAPRLSEDTNLSDEPKCRKSLRSAVITETDRLKIKLKISKKDTVELGKCKREHSTDMKTNRNQRHSIVTKVDDGHPVEKSEQDCKGNVDEPKMKLRSKREADEDIDQKKEESFEGVDENRKKINRLGEETSSETNDHADKPLKKRGRPSKAHIEDNERLEDKRRWKKLEIENDAEKNEMKSMKESFCWTCHKDGSVVKCDTCPRVFHLKCVSLSKDPSKDWICPECSLVLHAEKMSTRSEALKNLSLDQLCTLLNFAIGRMKNVPESQAFWKPVDPKEVPFYDKYISNPMDLNQLEKNMKAKMYGSPQAFLADAKWLLHNSIIFNSNQSPLTSTARFLVKICRQEMAEIENCPDCYLNAHTKKEWFVEVCRKPHILIWARLKGFPFWPAKAMSINLKNQSVDARFFGAHDKAWVPIKECYLYSKNSPQANSKKRTDLDDAFAEAEAYIKKIKQKYGTFCYAPDKTPFVPELYDRQLRSMIPTFQEEKMPKKKKRKQVAEENEISEKTGHLGKKLNEQIVQNRLKLNRSNSVDSSKVPEAICFMNDDVSDEKILSEDRICPEDEVARSLEMYDTAARVHRDAMDENSTDLEEDGSVRIPEHGYSRSVGSEPETGRASIESADDKILHTEESSSALENEVIDFCGSQSDEIACTANEAPRAEIEEVPNLTAEDHVITPAEVTQQRTKEQSEHDHCIVSSTCSDDSGGREEDVNNSHAQIEFLCLSKGKRKQCDEVKEEPPKKIKVQGFQEQKESAKRGEDRSIKSFTNLTLDKKQKILTEAKLLANIDEMTSLAKQKVLNELGLDASSVDVRQLAQENRRILETLNKNGHNEDNNFEHMPIKREDFEQYLMEECHQENDVTTEPDREDPSPLQMGSIKVRDIQALSNTDSPPVMSKNTSEDILSVKEVESIKDFRSNKKIHKKRTEDDCNSKKLKLEPVIELIKLDIHDKSLQKLNRKLGLSDEVSLIMVDSEKKNCSDVPKANVSKLPIKKLDRQPRARKSMPNRTRRRENSSGNSLPSKSSANINVISVDTENTNVQKNLLKSLCADDRKSQEDGTSTKMNKRTVLITTSDEGIKNVDVTVEDDTVKNSSSENAVGSFPGKDALSDAVSLTQQKNLTVLGNSHLILTNNGPTFLTGQNNQPNLALTQNNLGQLSLVHLTNLTSGIQTNFVNLANETIGLNNPIGTIYATPNFSGDSIPGTGNGAVLLTSSPATSVVCSPTGSAGKSGRLTEGNKVPTSKGNLSRTNCAISVRSPASLGLVTTQTNKEPPVAMKAGEPFAEVGSVTAELNRHSIKMAEHMRATIEDILRELSNQGSLEAKYKALTLEMEKLQWRHQQEIMELKQDSERSLMELRTTLESEKQKSLADLKSQLEARHQKIISETKSKQWCANCGKEALFYCCWNTSYCDYPCQQQHWPGHMSRCAQLRNNIQTNNHLQNKGPSNLKYQNANYVPMISRAGGSHSSGSFDTNRLILDSQAQSQERRSSDPPAPQLPINITIRPQHYFL